tara:strand:+ start:33060 stop:33689 length:630 start_codon:yes stop_codon:yes gene_type:complete
MEKLTLNQKLLAIQEEIGAIKKSKTNPYFNSNYFDINLLLDVVKPVLNKHKIVLMQPLVHIEGKPAIETVLLDTENDTMLKDIMPIVMPIVTTQKDGVSTTVDGLKAQEMGSAITYYRRYALQSLLSLEAEDDDGNKASNSVAQVTKNVGDNSKIPETVVGNGTQLPQNCPVCNKVMNLKEGKYGAFYSCQDYPTCKGTRNRFGEDKTK